MPLRSCIHAYLLQVDVSQYKILSMIFYINLRSLIVGIVSFMSKMRKMMIISLSFLVKS